MRTGFVGRRERIDSARTGDSGAAGCAFSVECGFDAGGRVPGRAASHKNPNVHGRGGASGGHGHHSTVRKASGPAGYAPLSSLSEATLPKVSGAFRRGLFAFV